MSQVYVCDRCGQVIDADNTGIIHIRMEHGALKTLGAQGIDMSADVCVECFEEIGDALDLNKDNEGE